MAQAYRVIGVGFDHMHIGDQLRTAMRHPLAEAVGVYDAQPSRAKAVLDELGIDVPIQRSMPDLIEQVHPDIAFVCSTTAEHVDLAATLNSAGVAVILEKPMADSEPGAVQMVDFARRSGVPLTVNWPLAWVPAHRTTHRLVSEGRIGRIEQVHYYDGNRGPLFHGHSKLERRPTESEKRASWWYRSDAGGGSLWDYLGYGTTLATWFRSGELPHAVTAVRHVPDGLEVDEQAVMIGHYAAGLSVFETRWGTFTDPWTLQPQPKCGFVLNGSEGSVSSWDYDDGVTLHDKSGPHRILNDDILEEDRDALSNLIAHLDRGRALDGPMTADISLASHRMIEAAVESARTGRTARLARV